MTGWQLAAAAVQAAETAAETSGAGPVWGLNVIDLIVLVVALVAAISGWRNGAIASILAFGGVVLGAVIGISLAPHIIRQISDSSLRLVAGLAVVIVLIVCGEIAGMFAGRSLRSGIASSSIRVIDSVAGSAVQAIAVLIAAWLLALPLATADDPELAKLVRNSRVLAGVDAVAPDVLHRIPEEFGALIDTSGLPDVLGPFGSTPIAEVDAPDSGLAATPLVAGLRSSILKVRGTATDCSRALEGTGFVIAPQRVLTNAHVVAGTSSVLVETADGDFDGSVVLYDPETDLAIVAVPGLAAEPLAIDYAEVPAGASGIVLGYPLDGPYTASPARVREEILLQGPNIYGTATVQRAVYTIRGQVRSGNSGGPLVNEQGAVIGVVFGAAVDASDTGYVLTVAEVAEEITAAGSLGGPVGTGPCTA